MDSVLYFLCIFWLEQTIFYRVREPDGAITTTLKCATSKIGTLLYVTSEGGILQEIPFRISVVLVSPQPTFVNHVSTLKWQFR